MPSPGLLLIGGPTLLAPAAVNRLPVDVPDGVGGPRFEVSLSASVPARQARRRPAAAVHAPASPARPPTASRDRPPTSLHSRSGPGSGPGRGARSAGSGAAA